MLIATFCSVVLGGFAGVLQSAQQNLHRLRDRQYAERERHARVVEHLAYHDALTGLPNRTKFSSLLELAVKRAMQTGRMTAVMYIDMDGFKNINDSLGHDQGDRLLAEIAQRLRTCIREDDCVSRLGGDEFAILLREIKSLDDAVAIAHKVLEQVALPVMLSGKACGVTSSIGISMCPTNGTDETTLKRKADVAMYEAKRGGKNRVHLSCEPDQPPSDSKSVMELTA